MKYMVDPPEGWRYGFPKEGPADLFHLSDSDFVAWFIDNGYPSHLIAQGMHNYSRMWSVNET